MVDRVQGRDDERSDVVQLVQSGEWCCRQSCPFNTIESDKADERNRRNVQDRFE